MTLRARVVLSLLLLVLVVGPAQAATFNVSITSNGFAPAALTIAVGDTVTWTNTDQSSRQIESQDARFTSPLLKPGETFSFTFTTAGRFTFRDAKVKRLRGTVTVQGPSATATVTQAASRSLVVYGLTVTLSGAVSSKGSGETVTVFAKPFGQTQFTAIGAAMSTSAGAWGFVVKPKLQTTYEARWKPTTGATAASSPVTVRVRPQVLFRVTATSGRVVTFFTKARAARSFAGKAVHLQRRNAFGQWVTLKKVTLSSTSSASFRARLPAGRSRVRVFMPQAQAGPGYAAGISRVLSLVR